MINETKGSILMTLSVIFTVIGGCIVHIGLGAIIVGLWFCLFGIAFWSD